LGGHSHAPIKPKAGTVSSVPVTMKRQKPGAKPDTATNIHPQVATWLEALSSQVQFPKKLWILLFFGVVEPRTRVNQ